MLKKIFFIILTLTFTTICHSQVSSEKYWIFFRDKGIHSSDLNDRLAEIEENLSAKVLKRRAKLRQQFEIVDLTDLPIYKPYLDELEKLTIIPINKSKWLNAISTYLSQDQLVIIKNLNFIKKVQPVVTFKRREPVDQNSDSFSKTIISPGEFTIDYGRSLTQNSTIHVTEVHEKGVNGTGVLVGMLDTGFNYQEHEVFGKLKVVAEYDFINKDNVTRNENDDGDLSGQHSHGTKTLSIIGGFKEGVLVGPAYGANYILGKTEDTSSETVIEEDYWVAGIEWMEENGVDVVSSSLGYNDWYDYSDMDGNTAITTKAADLAVEKGVVIVNSVGNEGNKSWRHMIAPADGDNVISVGAVYANGQITSYSSIGPTYDGRIKPDVLAMGSQVWYALPSKSDGYGNTSVGTSFSAPLVAGVAALVLSAHPYLTPFEVHDALRNTAQNAAQPNNEYGWGLVNALEAVFYHGFFFSNLPRVVTDEQGHKISVKIFSRNSIPEDSVFLYYQAGESANYTAMKMEPSSSEDEFTAWIPLQNLYTEINIYFSASDETGIHKNHPFYAPDEYFTFQAYDTTVNPKGEPKIPDDFSLYQNYPNPFNNRTKIKYDLFTSCHVNLSIYNMNGQLVKTLYDGFQRRDFYELFWDGTNANGSIVATGVYFYQLKAGNFIQVEKMLYLQ